MTGNLAMGANTFALAYPFGDPGTFDEVTKRAARMAGYRLGFSAQHAANWPGRIDPYAIGRLGVGVADSRIGVTVERTPLTVLAPQEGCSPQRVALSRGSSNRTGGVLDRHDVRGRRDE